MKKTELTSSFVAVVLSLLAVVPAPAGAAARSRTKTEPYSSPFLGHPEVYGTCINDMGCTRFGVGTKERYVSFDIADQAGADAYAYVVQTDSDGALVTDEVFCGGTAEPVAIRPSLEVRVILSPVTGTRNPCPSLATSGEVTATFSARP